MVSDHPSGYVGVKLAKFNNKDNDDDDYTVS